MEQSDYLEKQVEQLGRVLGKLLTDLTQASSVANPAEMVQQSQQELNGELDLDLEKLITKPDADFLKTVLANSKLNASNLQKLAEFMQKMSKFASPQKRKKWLQKSLYLYQHLEATSDTYDGFRIQQINKITKLLEG